MSEDIEELQREIRKLQNSLKAEIRERDTLDEQNSAQERKIHNLEKKLSECNKKIDDDQKELDTLESQLRESERKRRQTENEMGGYKTEISTLNDNLQRMKEEKNKIKTRLDNTVEEYEKEIEQLRKENRETKKANREIQYKIDDDKQKYEKKIAELKKENVRLSSTNASELASPRTPYSMPSTVESTEIAEAALGQVSKLMEANAELEISLEEYKGKVSALESQAKVSQKEAEELRGRAEECDTLRSENAALRQAKEEAEEALREHQSGAHERLEVERLSKKIEELEEERRSFVAEKMRLENDLTDARDAGDEMEEEVNKLEKECENLKDEIEDLHEELDDKDEEIRRLTAALEKSMEELKNKIECEDKDKKDKKEEDIQNKESNIKEVEEKYKEELEDKDDEIKSLKSKIEEYKLDVSDLEEEADEYEERINKMKTEIQDLTDDVEDYKEAADAARKASEELRARVATAEKAAEEAARKTAEREAAADADREQLSAEVRRLKQEVLRNHIAVAQKNSNGSNSEIQRLQDTIADLEANIDELKGEGIKLKRELLDAQDDLQDAEDRCKAADGRCAALDKEIAALEDALAGASKRGDSERSELAARVAELEKAAKEAAAKCEEHTKAAKEEIAAKDSEIQKLKEELAAARKAAEEAAATRGDSDSMGDGDGAAGAPQQRVLLAGLKRSTAHPRRRAPTSSSRRATAAATAAGGDEDEGEEDARVSPKMSAKDMEGAVAVLPMGPLGGGGLKSLRKTTSTISSGVAAADAAGSSADPSKIKRLIQIKGRRNVKSFLVEPVSSSLNSGDVFVLELVDRVFQWNGAKCNRLERSKGVDLATRISRTHGGFGRVITIEEGDSEPDDAYIFWRELGPKAAVKTPEEGGDDAQVEAAVAEKTRLYSVADASGSLAPVEAQQRLLYEMLDPTQCYILDCVSEVYAWVGKSSPAALRSVAVEAGRNLSRAPSQLQNGEECQRPSYAEFFRCNAGGEIPLFTDKFANWPGEATLGNAAQGFSYTSKLRSGSVSVTTSNIGGYHQQTRIHVTPLIDAEQPVLADDVDDGDDGTVKVWRIVEASKVEVDEERHGQFWSKNAYVVLYSYGNIDKSHIIYFWLGSEASKTEMGTAAATALNLSKVYRGASQIRVVQGMEPTHFLKLFHNHSFIIHIGRDDPSKKPSDDSEGSTRMYQIHGSELADTRIVEVPPIAAYLTTADTFILLVPNKTNYILHGVNSCEYIHNVASTACGVLLNEGEAEPTVIKQGEEPEEFWSALSATKKEDVNTYPDAKNPQWPGRMIAFTNKTGIVTAEPLWKFSQVDLAPSLMFLLDAWDTVFLWIGPKAKELEKKPALQCAADYAGTVAKKQPERGAVQALIVEQGKEPLEFTHYFVGWKFPQNNAGAAAAVADLKQVKEALEAYDKKYTIEELRDKASLPPTVDKSRLEDYLSDEDFAKVFGMTREKYLALPQWQRTPKKKAAGLF